MSVNGARCGVVPVKPKPNALPNAGSMEGLPKAFVKTPIMQQRLLWEEKPCENAIYRRAQRLHAV
jgi:hypothetical protein